MRNSFLSADAYYYCDTETHNSQLGCLPDYIAANADVWILSTDQSTGYRAQRGQVGVHGQSALPSKAVTWVINQNYYVPGKVYLQTSDWACACLIHYNRELSLAEVQQVEAWLDDQYLVVAAAQPLAPKPPNGKCISSNPPAALVHCLIFFAVQNRACHNPGLWR
jgi:hypothetical protein